MADSAYGIKLTAYLDMLSAAQQSAADLNSVMNRLQGQLDKKYLHIRFDTGAKKDSLRYVNDVLRDANASSKELKLALAAVNEEMSKLYAAGKTTTAKTGVPTAQFKALYTTIEALMIRLGKMPSAVDVANTEMAKFQESATRAAVQAANKQRELQETLAQTSSSMDIIIEKIKAQKAVLSSTTLNTPEFEKGVAKLAELEIELRQAKVELEQMKAQFTGIGVSSMQTSDIIATMRDRVQMLTNAMTNISVADPMFADLGAALRQSIVDLDNLEAKMVEFTYTTKETAVQAEQFKIRYNEAMADTTTSTAALSRRVSVLQERLSKMAATDPNRASVLSQIKATKVELEKLQAADEAVLGTNKVETSAFLKNIAKKRAALSALEKSVSNVNAKIQIWTERMNTTDVGSKKWRRATNEVMRLSEALAQLQYQTSLYTTQVGSINRINVELSEINRQWNAMGVQQKFVNGISGQLTVEAEGLLNKYRLQNNALKEQGLSLSEIIRKEEAEAAAQTAKIRKRQEENALLKGSITTIDQLNAKITLLRQKMNASIYNSAEFIKYRRQLIEATKQLEVWSATGEVASNKMAISMDKVNSKIRLQESYLGRLLVRMAAYSGVFAVFRMIRNIRDVTAEFEMQRVALGGIIQDAHIAGALFEKIKAAAIRSPFEIKDLVTYTKQLSAYRVETENLFDVTMRLADVSAGLGVDMNRLILAYGQVKSASVLRGQELRQFTEAGIPLVKLLADKFSDLYGEMVSTADVFDLISKRQVPFEMIAEIFEDMTNKGGIFYKMQEKQAETLKGQWANLKDAVSIMYDEIGNTESVNNAMVGMIKLLRNLASNWQKVSNTVKAVVVGYGTAKLVTSFVPKLLIDTKLLTKANEVQALSVLKLKAANAANNKSYRHALLTSQANGLMRMTKQLRAAATATTMFGQKWHLLMARLANVNPWSLAIAAVGALAAIIVRSKKASDSLAESLAAIGERSSLREDELIRNFGRLRNVIVDDTKSSKEQKEALEELNRTYGDIVPSVYLTTDALKDEADAYGIVTAAIKEKIAAEERDEKIAEIQSQTSEKIAKYENKIISHMLKTTNLTRDEIRRLLDDLKAEISSNEGFVNPVSAINRQILATEEETQKILMILSFNDAYYGKWVKNIAKQAKETNQVLADFDADTNALGKYTERWKATLEKIDTIDVDKTYESMKNATTKKVQYYGDFLKSIFKQEQIEWKDAYMSEGFLDIKAIVNAANAAGGQITLAVDKVAREYLKLAPPDTLTRVVNQKLENLAGQFKVSIEPIKMFVKDGETNIADFIKSVKEGLDDYEQIVTANNATMEALKSSKGIGPLDPKKVEEQEKVRDTLKAFYEFLEAFIPSTSKEENKAAKERINKLKEEMSVVQRLYDKYKEYLNYMSAVDAKQHVEDMFGESIKDLTYGAAFSASELGAILTKYRDTLMAMGEVKDAQEVQFTIDNIQWKEFEETLKDKFDKMKEDIANSEAARNFFNDILSKSGDEELARSMTLSVYGSIGEDLADKMVDEATQAFKDVDISGAIDEATKRINYRRLKELLDMMDPSTEYYKRAKEIVDNGLKSQEEIAKGYVDLLGKYQSVEEERLSITSQADEKIRQLEEGLQSEIATLGDKASEQDIKRARERAEATARAVRAQEKLDLMKLKPDYMRFFAEIHMMNADTAWSIRRDIREEYLKAFHDGAISADELRKNLRSIDEQYNKISKGSNLLSVYMSEGLDGLQKRVRDYSDELSVLISRLEDATDLGTLTDEEKSFVDTMLKLFGPKGVDNLTELFAKKGDMQEILKVLAQVAEKMGLVVVNSERAELSITNYTTQISNAINGIGNIFKQINAMRSGTNQIDFSWFDYLTNFSNYATDAFSKFISGDILGGVFDAVSSIMSIWGTYYDNLERRQEEVIKEQERLLKSLTESYNRLNDVASEVFGDEYLSNVKDRIELLEAEAEAYMAQAEAERAKDKKADEDKAKDYERQYRDTMSELDKVRKEVSERLTGTDVASAAKDFATAWLEAYISFSDTADALTGKFEEMIQNMVVESLLAKVVQSYLQPFFDEVDQVMKDSSKSRYQALSGIASQIPSIVGEINSALGTTVDALRSQGLNLRSTVGGLKGISRDIASASEESINGLAAGINTQNYYISGIYGSVNNILALLMGGTANVGQQPQLASVALDSYLSYIPTISQHTADTVAHCERIANACESTLTEIRRVIAPAGQRAQYQVSVNA